MFRHLRRVALSTLLAAACGTSDSSGGLGTSDLGGAPEAGGGQDPVVELDTDGLPGSLEPDVQGASAVQPGASATGMVAHTSSQKHTLTVGIGAGTPSVERKSSNYRIRFRPPGF